MIDRFTGKRGALVAAAVFTAVGLLLFPVYRYQINPDGIAYLSIAKHYGSGRWMDALNSCWPPMLSWLLAPWTNSGIELLWVFKVYNIITGAGCVYVSHRILAQYKLSPGAQLAGTILLAGMYLMWAFSITTPDLMSVLVMLIYARTIISKKYLETPVLIGVLGAIAYFTKSYCFFFFAAHITFQYVVVLLRKKDETRVIVRNYTISMGVFLLISIAWMLLLQLKYQKFTISSASAYTHGMLRYPNLACVNEFLPPPNREAVFAWEDPPLVCEHRDWSMFASTDDFKFQVKTVLKNTRALIVQQGYTAYLHLIGFAIMLIALFVGKKRKTLEALSNDPLFDLFPMIFIYTFGYLLIFIEPRYVWFCYALITIGTIVALRRLLPTWNTKPRNALLSIFVLLALSLFGVLYSQPKLLAPLTRVLTGASGEHKTYEFYINVKKLSAQFPPGKNMANWGIRSGQLRSQAAAFTYFTSGHHFGLLPASTNEAMKLVETHDIDLIILYKNNIERPAFLDAGWQELSPSPGDLLVYKRSE